MNNSPPILSPVTAQSLGFIGETKVDGSWDLTITVTDLQIEKTMRVLGENHIGAVVVDLVNGLDVSVDWSEHALWWPEKNQWLSRFRYTLDQYGVSADAKLHFTPTRKLLTVELPDLQAFDVRVDFSKNVFNAVVQICRELSIRHPEELSLMHQLTPDDLRHNPKQRERRRPMRQISESSANASNANGNGTLNFSRGSHDSGLENPHNSSFSPFRNSPRTPQGTLQRFTTLNASPGSPYSYVPPSAYSFTGTSNLHQSPGLNSASGIFEYEQPSPELVVSPQISAQEALQVIPRPRDYREKARLNSAWLDSSLSLMEQGFRDGSRALLRFKFYSFYDINPKYDAVRINQLYEQAKWQLISEQIDCTEDEMMMFAALQLQVQLRGGMEPPPGVSLSNGDAGDDIDAALSSLEQTLEGSTLATSKDISKLPELNEYLRFMRPKRFTLKSFKRYFFGLKDTTIFVYRSREEANGTPIHRINLKGCEVKPEVTISEQKFGFRLLIPESRDQSMNEFWIRCETEDQYARWMTACRLASKGKTMADSSFETEVKALLAFLSMQHPAPSARINPQQQHEFKPEDFVSSRFFKKFKHRQLSTKILEAHANVREMSLAEAKMSYINAWKALPQYGISHFLVRFRGSKKKEELLGIAFNRMILMDMGTGDPLKTWRFDTMVHWKVNWETKEVTVELEDQTVQFHVFSADAKVCNEFLGGYIFLRMRAADKNQSLNETMFHKLTGGWDLM